MQTIGKTTNKMDFPLNWTDILLKSLSGKTNYTIDVKIGTKRILTDNQDQRDITKKRRKQSNPTRISSNEDKTNQGFDIELISSEENKDELNGNESSIDIKLSSHQQPTTTIVPLNLSKSENQNTLSSEERRKIILSNNILQENESNIEAQKNIILSYQQFSKTNLNFENKDNYSSEHSICMPSIKDQPYTSVANVGQSSIQIFNPEAFCDQCNKEFCNKYFLKTHKANKHGVFFDTNSNSSILDQPDKSKVSSLLVTNDFSSNRTDISMGTSTSSFFKSPAVFSQPSINTNAYILKNMFNHTRAFCNICQKEFCNKYFVRRHKAKIHGIVDDAEYNRTSVDEVPLNYKINMQIENENENFNNEVTGTYDKDENAVSPSFDGHHTTPELISKKDVKLFINDTKNSAKNNEPMMKSTVAETPCDYIKIEQSDNEQNLKYTKKLSNEYNNVNDGNNSELNRNVVRIKSANCEQVVYPNGLSKLNVENLMQQSIEMRSNSNSPINLITNNSSSEHTVLMNMNNIVGNQINEANNNSNDDTVIEIVNNTKIDDAQIELINKSKLFTFNNLFLKFNGNVRENVFHEFANESEEPGEGSPIEHSCFGCHLTFNSDASLKAHCELSAECNVRTMGGYASTSSKNSAENDECVKFSRESGERKPSAMLSSFCKICNKELCNKYFMKTHMQRMHGISIQNGNHIGGVVCDVCNKELCSKYFLRVHKQNSHGIVESGGAAQKYWPDAAAAAESGHHQPSDELDANGHRYYRHYTEACGICFRRFRSSKWLGAHLLNDHGDEGRAQWKHVQMNRSEDEAKEHLVRVDCEIETAPLLANGDGELHADETKQYRCSYCPFATSILSFLFVHEKFHVAESKTAAEDATSPTCRNNVSPSPRDECNVVDDSSADATGNEPDLTDKPHRSENAPSDDRSSVTEPDHHHEPFIMQSFFLENCSVSPSAVKSTGSSGRSDSFHSSLVYLPVKEKLTSTVNVFFKLTPT